MAAPAAFLRLKGNRHSPTLLVKNTCNFSLSG